MGSGPAPELAVDGSDALKPDHLLALFEHARKACGHTDYVVVGSLAILGLDDEDIVPAGMTMSIDIDCYTRTDPERIFELKEALGEGSDFHVRHGYYLDPVSSKLPTLPDGWEGRMNQLERQGLRIWFLDPNDAAISKYARGEPKDLSWIRAGIEAGIVSLPIVRARLRDTSFIDDTESLRVKNQLERDSAWFGSLRARRN